MYKHAIDWGCNIHKKYLPKDWSLRLIKNSQNSIMKRPNKIKKWANDLRIHSPKKIYEWPVNTLKSDEHHHL